MGYRRVNVYEFDWYRPEDIPVCDRCECEIRGEYAETRDQRVLCPDCVDDEHLEEGSVEWCRT